MDKWDARFMEVADLVASWSSCLRRQVGAVVVKDNRILTTGYNGAPQNILPCRDKGFCMRERDGIKSGTQQEKCYAVHAEQNAIIQAAKLGVSLSGGTLYCNTQPCVICAKMIINSGIKRIVYTQGYPDEMAIQLFKECGISYEKYE